MAIFKIVRRAAMVLMGAAMVGLGMATTTEPATAPATQARTMPAGPTVNVEITEWVVFIADMTSKQLNRREAFDNTLPSFVNNSRREAAVKSAAPMGVIRLTPTGLVNTDVAIDVQVMCKTGKVLGHWPPGKPRGSGVLWQDVHFAATTEKPRELPTDTWMGDLRGEGGGAVGQMLTCGTVTEPFLLYDLEVSHTVNLQVASGEEGKYKVANTTDSAMLDLTFYKKAASGKWRTGKLEKLEKTAALPTTAPATSQPTSQPASQPAVAEAAELVMSEEGLDDDAVLAFWRTRLAEANVSPNDQQLILKILTNHALDARRLTAIYRMDPVELDKLLQLEVVPQAQKVSRIALVVVRDIDPAVADEISELIGQLGDASWERREAAMTELRKIGVKAKPQLEKAVKEKDKDLEIVYRAEQLLQAIAGPEVEKPQN